jgi:RNA polymerase sigma-70 factor (ECF subfamily)
MLGSLSETEDALQETWLRVRDKDPATVDSMRGWLTTVVARVCLNKLRSRRRRREVLTDFHVPDPVVTLADRVGPEEEALLGDSIGLALLVVLDRLTPAERVAFVLHDAFELPFAEIATILERSEAAAQQLASRARRRVGGTPVPDRDPARQRKVVEAFFAASRDGDFVALLAVLDPEVELRIDGGGRLADASVALRGAGTIASRTATYAGLYPQVQPALVNGAAGAVVARADRLFSVMAFTIANKKVVRIDCLIDPERLAALGTRFMTRRVGA